MTAPEPVTPTDIVIGVDIGGTFTDCAIILPDGRAYPGKTPTTPHNRAQGFFDAIADAAAGVGMTLDDALARCRLLVHGTTTGTNALIERQGAKVGLITTAGHGDATLIMKAEGRLAGVESDQLWDLASSANPEPLVPRSLIREVDERTDFLGDEIVPLDLEQVREAAGELVALGAQAIAVSFLWSVRNARHELAAKEAIEAAHPGVFVSVASALSSQVGEYERTMTAIINAYIGPLMHDYVQQIADEAAHRGYRGRLLYAQCAGGAITEAEAQVAPVRTVHSGPVSGLLGSAFMAAAVGEPDLMVADMGGTSFDVSVIRGLTPDVRDVSLLERFEVSLPMVYVDTIGAGGGSVAWLDAVGGLQVGPRSAGALPGPACYGNGGTEPTVTDADVVLGIVDPDNFLHGRRTLDRAAAERAIASIAEPLGLTVEQTAAGINQIIDSKMADLLRRMSILRGFDPREYTVFAYGGGGPVHVGAVAREVGVRKVIVPMLHMASAWSAYGATVADMIHVVQRWEQLEMPAGADVLNATLAELDAEAREILAGEGFEGDRVAIDRALRMKYTTQLHTIEVPIGAGPLTAEAVDAILDDFSRLYDDLHGAGSGHRAGGVSLTGFVLRARGVVERAPVADAPPAAEVTHSRRPVYWSELGDWADTPVIGMTGGRLPGTHTGPLLVELPDTVVVVRPGQTAACDAAGNLVITLDTPR